MTTADWKEWALSLLFPLHCFLCGKPLPDTGWLCPSCTPPEAAGFCTCGKPPAECICQRMEGCCQAVVPAWVYTQGVERGIHRFKYDGCSYYAPFLGQAVARAVQEQLGEVPFDWVTYVPTSRARLRERGYCQTQLLARETAARLGLPVKSGILAHTGEGTQQARQKGLRDRQANAEKNFTLAKRPDLTGQRVLLVDDVYTSGSTLFRCAGLLSGLGAQVWAAAVASAVRHKDACQGGGNVVS